MFRCLSLHVCIFFWIQGQSSYCYTIDNIKELTEHLFNSTDYDQSLRPLFNQSKPMKITLSMRITSIGSFDMMSGRLDSRVYLIIQWQDEFLTWDSKKYGGIRRMQVDASKVWTPTITHMYDTGNAYVSSLWLTSTGHVRWIKGQEHQTFCRIEITYYPFDFQSCDLIFFPVDGKDEIELITNETSIGFHEFSENSEWDVVSNFSTIIIVGDKDPDGVPMFLMLNNIKLKRLPWFTVIHSVLPAMVLALLKIMVFKLPAESGERVSFSVALILAFTVFLSSLSSELPHNSRALSIYSILLTTENCLCSLCAVLSVLSVKWSNRNDKPVPRWIQSLLQKVSFSKRNDECPCECSHEEDETKMAEPVSWKTLMQWLDCIFFWSFIGLTLLTFLVVGIIWSAD